MKPRKALGLHSYSVQVTTNEIHGRYWTQVTEQPVNVNWVYGTVPEISQWPHAVTATNVNL